MSSPLTSIVMLTMNEWRYTELALRSLAAHTPERHEIIVVDNGSTDGTPRRLAAFPGVRVIANAGNRGFAAGSNQGILASQGDEILLLNNDVLLTPGWLAGLRRALGATHATGMAGPISNYVSGLQLDRGAAYHTPQELLAYATANAARNAGRFSRVDRLVGFALLFRRDLVERIGLLDERFGRGNFEDDDYGRRARIAGYDLVIAHDVFIHHFGSRSFVGNGIDYGAEMERNQAIFTAKWTLPPEPRRAPAGAAGSLPAAIEIS